MEKLISGDEESGKSERSNPELSGIFEEWIELLIRYKKFLVRRNLLKEGDE